MGLFRNIFAGFFGAELSKIGAMAYQDPHWARELKANGIKMTHEIQNLDAIEDAFRKAIHSHITSSTKIDEKGISKVKMDQEKALSILDKIIGHEELSAESTIKIAQMLVKVLREDFRADVLMQQHNFPAHIARQLENDTRARLAKLASEMHKIGNIFIEVGDEAKSAA